MKLFILAAGKGTRLLPLTKDMPKVLLDLGDGKTLLDTQLKNAIQSKYITEVVIISGYCTSKIRKQIKPFLSKIKIHIIHNPFYDLSNNLMSLWVAQFLMQDKDFVITNGDNMYKEGIYDQVLDQATSPGIYLTIDYKQEYDDDDMKVSFKGSKVHRVHKQIPEEETGAESVGFSAIIGEESRATFRNELLFLAEDGSYLNKFWLEIFNSIIHNGGNVSTCEIDHDSWQEVDFHPDIDLMKAFILRKR